MDSQFKVLEPVCGDLRNPKNAKFKAGRTGFLGKTHEWFKIYQVSVNASLCTDVEN